MAPSRHPYVDLAFRSIEHYLHHNELLPCPEILGDDLKQKAGAFVSIKKGELLRGCIGTLEPTQPHLAQEIIQNAVSAATRDPRFEPLSNNELDEIRISVDVLTRPTPIRDLTGHDIKRHGLVVKSNLKQGVLLPDLEGVNSPEDQLRICLKKAKIGDSENYEMFRFEVRRYPWAE